MQEHRNDEIIVRYDPHTCIHAGECVRGLPTVFNLSKDPWIDVNGASLHAIVEQVTRCPSGALTYEVLKKAPSVIEPASVLLRPPNLSASVHTNLKGRPGGRRPIANDKLPLPFGSLKGPDYEHDSEKRTTRSRNGQRPPLDG